MNVPNRALAERTHLTVLTSTTAGEMLRAALAHRGSIHSWRVHNIHHRPGAGVTVGYSVVLNSPTAHGRRSDVYVLASTANINQSRLATAGGITLSIDAPEALLASGSDSSLSSSPPLLSSPPLPPTAPSIRVHVWEYPRDPELPALAMASDAEKFAAYIGCNVNIELLSYRPTRRAVFRVECDEADIVTKEIYAKVVRPQAHADLVHRLRLLADSRVPSIQLYVPHTGITPPPGLVLTQAAHGIALSHFYASFTPRQSQQADAMLARLMNALSELPQASTLFPRKPAWAERCEHYAHAAGLAFPAGAARAKKVAATIRHLFSQSDLGPTVAVHGDFYEANVMIQPDSGEITAILDVDSLGPGYRVHDWGCLLGHLAVLRSLAPQRYRHTETLCSRWFDQLCEHVDPVALCASTAGVVLSLVAGAQHRRGTRSSDAAELLAEERLAIAEEWVAAGCALLTDPHYNATIIPLR